MTVKELFDFIKGVRPGFAFTDAQLTVWLNEIEGHVQTDIWLLEPAVDETQTGLVEYDSTIDPETGEMVDANHELLVPFPWNKLYRYFLLMSIDLANGEYQRYANSYELFNEAYEEYAGWYAQHVSPANGEAITRGYYISAYQFAARGGYAGTEKEFYETLGRVSSIEANAESAAASAFTSATNAEASADEAHMWANGGEAGVPSETNNAKHYADQAKAHYGAPLVALTAAEMEEQDRVYVYVGNETGYTNGNWYYFDGSSWVSGGVYNSTAFVTDKTLTQEDMAADAAATGEVYDIALAAFDEETVTGNPAACEDGADNIPLAELIANIQFVQDGTGDPSSSNIRHITGYDNATITVSDATQTREVISENFDDTVYAGNLDLLTGVLTITHGYAETDANGKLHIIYPESNDPIRNASGIRSSNYVFYSFPNDITPNPSYPNKGSYCSHFIEQRNTVPSADEVFTIYTPSYKRFIIRCTSIPGWTTATSNAELAAAAESYFASSYPQNKLQLVFKLANPIEIQLDKHQIASVEGYNSISTNCGTVSVTYRVKSKTGANVDTEYDSSDKLHVESFSHGHIKYIDKLDGHRMTVYGSGNTVKTVDGSQYISVKPNDIVNILDGYPSNTEFPDMEVYIYFYDADKKTVWSVFDHTDTESGDRNRIKMSQLKELNGLQFNLTSENASAVRYMRVARANDCDIKIAVWDGIRFGMPLSGYTTVLEGSGTSATKVHFPEDGSACLQVPTEGLYLIARPGYTFLRFYSGQRPRGARSVALPAQVLRLRGGVYGDTGPQNVVIVKNYTYGQETPTWDKESLATDLSDAVVLLDMKYSYSVQKPVCYTYNRMLDMVNALTTGFKWTPLENCFAYDWEDDSVPPVTHKEYFKAGVTYSGVPYKSIHSYAVSVGWHVTKRTFMSAAADADSIFYKTSAGASNPEGPWYCLVCSTFATLVGGFRYPMTNYGLMKDPGVKFYKSNQPIIGEVMTNGISHCVVPLEIYTSDEGGAQAVKIVEQGDPASKHKVLFKSVVTAWNGIGSNSTYMENYRVVCSPDGYDPVYETPYNVETYTAADAARIAQATARPRKGDCSVYTNQTSDYVVIDIQHLGGTATTLYVQKYSVPCSRGIPNTSQATTVGSVMTYQIESGATKVQIPVSDLENAGIYGVWTDLDANPGPDTIEYFEYYDVKNVEIIQYRITDGVLVIPNVVRIVDGVEKEVHQDFWYAITAAWNYRNPYGEGKVSGNTTVAHHDPTPPIDGWPGGEMPDPPPPSDYSANSKDAYITRINAFFRKGKFGAYVTGMTNTEE